MSGRTYKPVERKPSPLVADGYQITTRTNGNGLIRTVDDEPAGMRSVTPSLARTFGRLLLTWADEQSAQPTDEPQPDDDGWYKHDPAKGQPVADDVLVQVRWPDVGESLDIKRAADWRNWSSPPKHNGYTHYKIVSEASS